MMLCGRGESCEVVENIPRVSTPHLVGKQKDVSMEVKQPAEQDGDTPVMSLPIDTEAKEPEDKRGDSLMELLPEEVLWGVMMCIKTTKDRNSMSLVCRRFYEMERLQRTDLKAGCGMHPAQQAISSLCKRFTQLTTVEITYAGWVSSQGEQIDDEGLHVLASECKLLTNLSLCFCGFLRDPGFAKLANFGSNLNILKLNFIPGITGRGLLSLVSGCQRITTLQLTRCMQVKSTEWLELLGRKGRLEHLSIRYCKFIGEGDLAKFGIGWRRLQEFCFEVDPTQRYMEVFVVKPSQPQRYICTELKALTLTNCVAIPGQGLAQVLAHSEALMRLHLDMCTGVRDADFLGLRCTQLQSLSLRLPANFAARQIDGAALTDASLGCIAERCHQLEEVSIRFADIETPTFSSISGEGISSMVQWCSSLRVLVLDRANSFTDACMEVVAESESLQLLQLTECQEVSDVGIRYLRQSHLLELRLFRCLKITDAGFIHLVGSNILATLRVEGCPAISKAGILGVARTAIYKHEWRP